MKSIAFVINHPAQYHFAKHVIKLLKDAGNKVIVIIKTKDVLEQLLKSDGVEYINIQKRERKKSKLAILYTYITRFIQIFLIVLRKRVDVIVGTTPEGALVAKLLKRGSITTLEDDAEVIKELAKSTYPVTDVVVVPTPCSVGKWSDKKIGYEGYMKLAYLHPNRFLPDQGILKKYDIQEPYCLLRLAKLAAYHDAGIGGLNTDLVHQIIHFLEEKGYNVYITSEYGLSENLKRHKLKIDTVDIHHILNYASMLISDSQSMSVEAAMLGVPSLRFSDFTGRISVLEELEKKYHLTFGISTNSPNKLIEKLEELLRIPNLKNEFKNRQELMLKDKIDVTAFFFWFISEYPHSKKIMINNPQYQQTFK